MFLLVFAESIQLFPDGTLFVHIALILLMIWILNRTFFKPINRVIAAREKFRGGRNVEAEELKAAAAEKLNRFNAETQAARARAYELMEKERAAAIAQRGERIGLVKSETEQYLTSESSRLHLEAEQARGQLAREADALADRIVGNILKS